MLSFRSPAAKCRVSGYVPGISECAICCEDMAGSLGLGTDGVRTMECGHRYHARCVHQWLVKFGKKARCKNAHMDGW